MTKEELVDTLHDLISSKSVTLKNIHIIRGIIQKYPETKDMTLKEVEEFLYERVSVLHNKIVDLCQ